MFHFSQQCPVSCSVSVSDKLSGRFSVSSTVSRSTGRVPIWESDFTINDSVQTDPRHSRHRRNVVVTDVLVQSVDVDVDVCSVFVEPQQCLMGKN